MKKLFLFVLTAMMICGCSKNENENPAPPEEDIFSVDEVRFTDDGFFTLYFFFIDTDSIGFQSSAGFSLGRHDGCFIG